MGIFDSVFSPAKSIFGSLFPNPADSAKGYLNQIPSSLHKYFDPYVNAGKGSLDKLQGIYGNMLKDPGSIYSSLAKGYQSSPGYDFTRTEALNGANSAAAAGGMSGTPSSMETSGKIATGLADEDFEKYLSHIFGLYGQGLQGEEGINKMGYEASTGLGEDLVQSLMSQANLGYAGQDSQNNMMASLLKAALSAGGMAAGGF